MQIVIDIPVSIYSKGLNEIDHKEIEMVADAIRNGTPLPKGHGDLIDVDELYSNFIDGTEGYDCNTWNRIEIGDIIEDAPTIIEADKAGNEVQDAK